MKFLFTLIIMFAVSLILKAQYPPAAGLPGSTAIHKDSAIFVSWADSCIINRGFVNISDTNFQYGGSNYASYGMDTATLGVADNNVVSLGDAGCITYYFTDAVYDGPGYDFAVFENALTDDFLELAFVEVSSNGIDFYRFPCHSLTQDSSQVATYGTIETTKINGFAGKYRALYGSPFDLSIMDTVAGLDVMHIIAIRVKDVVGSIDTIQSYDSYGNIINDPWPTPFNSSGFDIDALGVIHNIANGVDEEKDVYCNVYPNPTTARITIESDIISKVHLRILSIDAREVFSMDNVCFPKRIDISDLAEGIYFLEISTQYTRHVFPIIKQE